LVKIFLIESVSLIIILKKYIKQEFDIALIFRLNMFGSATLRVPPARPQPPKQD